MKVVVELADATNSSPEHFRFTRSPGFPAPLAVRNDGMLKRLRQPRGLRRRSSANRAPGVGEVRATNYRRGATNPRRTVPHGPGAQNSLRVSGPGARMTADAI
jgi:hypothetical protein